MAQDVTPPGVDLEAVDQRLPQPLELGLESLHRRGVLLELREVRQQGARGRQAHAPPGRRFAPLREEHLVHVLRVHFRQALLQLLFQRDAGSMKPRQSREGLKEQDVFVETGRKKGTEIQPQVDSDRYLVGVLRVNGFRG